MNVSVYKMASIFEFDEIDEKEFTAEELKQLRKQENDWVTLGDNTSYVLAADNTGKKVIYRHHRTDDEGKMKERIKKGLKNDNPIDIVMYKTTIGKKVRIDRVFDFGKRNAFDCYIHRERNEAKCLISKPEVVDYTTKLSLFHESSVKEIVTQIKRFFLTTLSASLDTISESLGYSGQKGKTLLLMKVLLEITDNRSKYPILDRLGTGLSLFRSGDIFFAGRETFSTESYPSDAVYGTFLIGQHNKDTYLFADYIMNKGISKDKKTVNDILKGKGEEVKIQDLTADGKIFLLELAVISLINSGAPFLLDIVNRFRNYMYGMEKPTRDIRDVMSSKKKRKGTQGRRPEKIEYISRASEPDPTNIPNFVFLHTMPSYETSFNTKHSISRNLFGGDEKIRLLGFPYMKWRDLTFSERKVYKDEMRDRKEKAHGLFEKKGIYGIYQDGDFKIRKPGLSRSRKKKTYGTKCSLYKERDMLNLLKKLKVQSRDVQTMPNLSNSDMWKKWYKDNGKEIICGYLLEKFRTEGKLFTGFNTMPYTVDFFRVLA
uniref:Uncharacterized protein n=1 Tax=Pithovirus LCDPAC01 TaxID=2506600 RepID=A0A481YMR9_9VIRU|nr:MAG: hypothetical protein LCDPAC01_01410 [Pithovirus LCDPAC01]